MQEPAWITHVVAEAVHADQLREHGGLSGLRDEGALEASLARARQRWHYQHESDLADLAAAYGFGLATSHPFRDGNKRTAFLAMITFLEFNGAEFESADAEVVAVMLAVADGTFSEAELAAWIRTHAQYHRQR